MMEFLEVEVERTKAMQEVIRWSCIRVSHVGAGVDKGIDRIIPKLKSGHVSG